MLRKYTLIISVLTVMGLPFRVQAQTTMDAAMKIQSVLDQFSEIRSTLKQVKSSMNIKTMLQNLKGNGDWKQALKKAGGIFDSKSEQGASQKALMLLPDGLAEKADKPDEAMAWLNNNLFLNKKNASISSVDEVTKKNLEFQFVTMITSYGKAVAMRKQLDRDIATIEQLRQDAEAKEAETDLQNEINKLTLLKVEQANYKQLLVASNEQVSNLRTLTVSGAKAEEGSVEIKDDQADDAKKADEKKTEKADEKKTETEKSKTQKAVDKASSKAAKVLESVNKAADNVQSTVNKYTGKETVQQGSQQGE